MANPTFPESPPVDTERETALDAAPSQLAAEEPSFARTVGMVGVGLAIFGAAIFLFNEISGPRIISKPLGTLLFLIGLVFMLYHAVRDANIDVRRTYGILLGFGLVGVAAVLTLVSNGELLVTYGAASLVGGLCFLLAFARHEDDPQWRPIVVGVLAALGGAQALVAFVSIVLNPDYVAGAGGVLGLIGLLYLGGTLAQFDEDAPWRRQLAIGLAALAAFGIVYVAIRSWFPAMFGAADRPFFVPGGLIVLLLSVLYGALALGTLSDAPLVVMTRRELGAFFYSPIAYLVWLGMAMLLGLNHLFFVLRLGEGGTFREPIVRQLVWNLIGAIGTVMFVPAITMRLLAEEKRSGTYEVLMCAPVREGYVVLSKFFAGLIFFMLLWVPMGLYLVGLRIEAGKPFDYRPLLSFYLALLFSGAAFIAMGVFFSSLTRNQIIAFVLTLAVMVLQLLFFMIEGFRGISPLWQSVFHHLGYLNLWSSAIDGRLPVRDIVLQGSLCVFWLFLTVKVVEARRWS